MFREFIIRARGLPYSISKGEIEAFFNTSQLKSGTADGSIHITYNDEGRPSGECYVEFCDEDSYHNAMRKNKEYLGSRYIEVFDSDSDDMHRALSKGSADRTTYGVNDEPVVKLRGLPFAATEDDIKQFFGGLEIVDLKLLKKSTGEPKGDGYVRFDSQEAATSALTKHMEKMDWRYIEVFKATDNEMRFEMGLDTKKPARGRSGGGGGGGGGGFGIPGKRGPPVAGEHRILMRGIPFQASQGDVIKFFAPLLPRHIELIDEAGGRPSGQAYAFFNCHEDAELAMEKDKDYMESRYVELFIESHPDAVMAAPQPLGVMPPRPRGPNPMMADPNAPAPQPVRKRLMAGAPPKIGPGYDEDQEFYTNERRAKKPKKSPGHGGPPGSAMFQKYNPKINPSKQRLLPPETPYTQPPPPPPDGAYQDPYAAAAYGAVDPYSQQVLDPYAAQPTQYAGYPATTEYSAGAGYPGMGLNQYAAPQYADPSQQYAGYGADPAQMGQMHPSRAGY